MNADSRFSEAAFFQFIDFVGKKGLVKDSKASNWKSAGIQMLSILDADEKKDLRGLDVEQLINRFANLKGTEVTSSSLKIYKSRFKGAYIDFMSWAEDPVNYSPSGRTLSNTKSNGGAKKKKGPGKTPKSNTSPPSQVEHQTHSMVAPAATDSVIFPIPISGGRIITINNLPHELSKADAEKISAVVRALAIAEPKE